MVATMEKTNGLVGDAEVDAMLRQAQKELLAEQSEIRVLMRMPY
jgi:hypothetical protein